MLSFLVRRITTAIACLGALYVAAPADAAVRELGVSEQAPLAQASCPTDCQAIGRVTGYPTQIGTVKSPFYVRTPGTIVGFSVRLGKPNAEQTMFFENLFGGEAQVRLSVLQPWRRWRKLKLVSQSEVVNVQDYFGSTPTFALKKPIRVSRRRVIALTVPTWVPAFAVNQPSTTAWRFSRKDCDNAEEAAAHQSLRSSVPYRCLKRTARPLYTVSFIPDPKKTNTTRAAGSRKAQSSSTSDSETGGVRP